MYFSLQMIDQETINRFFANIKSKGDFEIQNELTWGFFFVSINVDFILDVKNYLVNKGYQYVDLFEAEKEQEGDESEFFLHMQKIEIHTAETLNERNKLLYGIAEKFDVEYDGFDLGRIESQK